MRAGGFQKEKQPGNPEVLDDMDIYDIDDIKSEESRSIDTEYDEDEENSLLDFIDGKNFNTI